MLTVDGTVVARFGGAVVDVALVEHAYQLSYFRARVMCPLPGEWCVLIRHNGTVEFMVFQKYIAYATWKEEFANNDEILLEEEIL